MGYHTVRYAADDASDTVQLTTDVSPHKIRWSEWPASTFLPVTVRNVHDISRLLSHHVPVSSPVPPRCASRATPLRLHAAAKRTAIRYARRCYASTTITKEEEQAER